MVANTECGKLVGSKQSEPRLKRPPWRVADGKGTVLALSKVGRDLQDLRNTNSLKVESRAICKFCNGKHELEKRFMFRDKRYAQRKEFIRKQNLCENCLKPNHVARRCRSPGACLLSGCKERQHSLLHPPSFCVAPRELARVKEDRKTTIKSTQVPRRRTRSLQQRVLITSRPEEIA